MIDFSESHPVVVLAVCLLEPNGDQPFTLPDLAVTRLLETIHADAASGKWVAGDLQPILRGLTGLSLLLHKVHGSPVAAGKLLDVAEAVARVLAASPEDLLAARVELDTQRAQYDALLGTQRPTPDPQSPAPQGSKKWWDLR